MQLFLIDCQSPDVNTQIPGVGFNWNMYAWTYN